MDLSEFSTSLTTPGRLSRAIEPSDSSDLPNGPAKGLYVCATGIVSFLPIDNPDDDPVRMSFVGEGTIIPFIVRRVLATGTTAILRTIEDLS